MKLDTHNYVMRRNTGGNVFLVLSPNTGARNKVGHIAIDSNTLYLPKELVGKRIRVKIEVVE